MITLDLEEIRDWPRNERAAVVEYERRRAQRRPARKPTPRRPWVAEIKGASEDGGLLRTFVRGFADYRDARGTGRRGVRWYFPLHDGRLYEVRKLIDENRERRYFARVEDSAIVEMTGKEVAAWLAG